jgi:hypothetical protein
MLGRQDIICSFMFWSHVFQYISYIQQVAISLFAPILAGPGATEWTVACLLKGYVCLLVY